MKPFSLPAVLFLVSAITANANDNLLSKKLAQIEFNETPISDAVNYLRERSRELDPAGVGLNLVTDPTLELDRTTTLTLHDVTLGVTLVCLAEQTGIDYRKEAHAFVLLPAGKGTLAERELQPHTNATNGAQAQRARSILMSQIEFDEAPLRDVLQYIAAKSREDAPGQAGLNLIVDHRIDQEMPVSLRLNQVPASAVLGYVARTTGIEIRIEPWAIMIEAPGTKWIREARIKELQKVPQQDRLARWRNEPRGNRYGLGTPPKDPRSPAHPDYVHSTNPDKSLRTNALNNVYKWVGGKWTFVRYGSKGSEKTGLQTGSL